MFNLFLETQAAAQIIEWCKDHPGNDPDVILLNAYTNAINSITWEGEFEYELVRRSLEDNDHVVINVCTLFEWDETPEGYNFWSSIHDVKVPIPKVL
jgi:hypothetical protein